MEAVFTISQDSRLTQIPGVMWGVDSENTQGPTPERRDRLRIAPATPASNQDLETPDPRRKSGPGQALPAWMDGLGKDAVTLDNAQARNVSSGQGAPRATEDSPPHDSSNRDGRVDAHTMRHHCRPSATSVNDSDGTTLLGPEHRPDTGDPRLHARPIS